MGYTLFLCEHLGMQTHMFVLFVYDNKIGLLLVYQSGFSWINIQLAEVYKVNKIIE